MDEGRITGTRDVTYDLISVIYHALQGAETYQTYVEDARATGDGEAEQFFREAQDHLRSLADRGKALLGQRLGSTR